MSTTEPPGAMTAGDHVREAERYTAAAAGLEGPGGYERTMRRSADLQAAQVHATLAQTLKATELLPLMATLADWIASSGAPSEPATTDGETTP